MHQNHARKNAAREVQRQQGLKYAEALKLARAERATGGADGTTRPSQQIRPGDPRPVELRDLVAHHFDSISAYFYEILSHGEIAHDYAEYCRMLGYRLTDALEHMLLLVGTYTAHMQENRLSPDRIRTYLQVRDHAEVDAFVTPAARQQLGGLMGRPDTEGDLSVWHHVGEGVRNRGAWVEADREAMLLGLLASLYANVPDDSRALDHLPPNVRRYAHDALALRFNADAGQDAPEPPI
ncbi:hypothetical protein [Streptacidiphilus albus]|uniref:hypothetical protein n=1 Tax=Streptacidiphilus albus TaxID=105425 RepID=UPI00054BF7FB|nr:hypothetical protein [Streptacidiphilus albus]